jgi:serine/threonine-protein kinase
MPEGAEEGTAARPASGASAIPGGKIFISYASQDAGIANSLVQALERADIPCWIAPRDVVAGEFYADAIVHAIDAARALVLVLSQSAAASHHILREVERASSKRHPVIALRIDRAPLPAGLEYFLNSSQWLDTADADPSRAFPKLIDATRGALGGAASAAIDFSAKTVSSGTAVQFSKRDRFIAVIAVISLIIAFLAIGKIWWSPRRTESAQRSLAAATGPAAVPTVTPSAFAPPPHSIAVLPFTNLSGDSQQEYFSDGMTEELINALSHVEALQVTARTSSFSFKGQNIDVGTIARKLNVGAILEGSVRRDGGTVRITAQLINAVNGFHMWSENYDRDLKDVLSLQTDIATTVAQQLRVKLLGNEAAKIEVGGTHVPEAYDAYLLGREISRRGGLKNYRQAIVSFRKATELDPGYAAAYANLAIAEANAAGYTDDAAGLDRARIAADRALVLAPQMAGGYRARFLVRRNSLNFPGALADAQRGLALSPNEGRSYNAYGLALATFGRLPEAVEALKKSVELDPLNEADWFNLGICLLANRDFLAARRAFERDVALSPEDDSGYFQLGVVDLLEGRLEDSSADFRRDGDVSMQQLGVALVEHSRGHERRSQQALESLIAKRAGDSAYQIAEGYAWRGDKNMAFEWLERAVRQRDSGLGEIAYDALLIGLRSDSRYDAMLEKLKLSE